MPLIGGIAFASIASFYIHNSINLHSNSEDGFLDKKPNYVDNELNSHGFNRDKVFQTFLSNVAQYNKIYQNQKEFETRFDIFKNKLLTVLRHNSFWEKGIAPFEMEIN